MKQYCLSKEELHRFIEVALENRPIYDDEPDLKLLVDGCSNWDIELICFTLFLSQVLEHRLKSSTDQQSTLRGLYGLSQEKNMALDFEGVDESFVRYMLEDVRDNDLSIDENLMEILLRRGEHTYS